MSTDTTDHPAMNPHCLAEIGALVTKQHSTTDLTWCLLSLLATCREDRYEAVSRWMCAKCTFGNWSNTSKLLEMCQLRLKG